MSKFNWGMRACGILLLWAAAAIALPAQTFTTLHSFTGTDGATPYAGLVQATDGNFYGTTYNGGVDCCGTVFKITPSGTLAMLYSFTGTDGANPASGLILATNGNLYGTTYAGGTTGGKGTVFKITLGGTLTTLHGFGGANGAYPEAVLVQGTDGNFYGTTVHGGMRMGCEKGHGCGTIFKITPHGTLTTLHEFARAHGAYPYSLVQGTDGNFYGATANGGANNSCSQGCGTIFKITPSGTLTTLHSFDSTDGAEPTAGLAQGTDGNFYGTTDYGGANNQGTVFKITPSGTLTTLYSFCSQTNCTDGSVPLGLVQATDGNFYGTTFSNGSNGPTGSGTAFSITPSGTLTTLYSFCSQTNCTDGQFPFAGLVQATDGNFYGTTSMGGTNNEGTVFSLSVGLGPFVETNPTSGTLGAAVIILGTNLTGTTSVTFNGTAATFTVKSTSEITTTVPTGATTGTVQVVTPGGTLSSNVPFRVTS
jgi:uncharacterized repeat protein (TIGR03803 family)